MTCFSFIGCKKNIKCDECDEITSCTLYTYNLHSSGATKVKLYLCDDCSDTYKYHSNFKPDATPALIKITILIVVIAVIYNGVYWGKKTNAIVKSKNYDEDWFWKGFWSRRFAYLEALILPDKPNSNSDSNSTPNK